MNQNTHTNLHSENLLFRSRKCIRVHLCQRKRKRNLKGRRCGYLFMEKYGLSNHTRKYLWTIISVFAVYFGMKYISPVISPFVLAFLAAGFINPIITRLQKRIRVKKSILAGIVLLFFLLIAVILCWGVSTLLLAGAKGLAEKLPGFREEITILLESGLDHMESGLGIDGIRIENFITDQVEILTDNLEVNVFPVIMDQSVNIVRIFGNIFAFLAVSVIALLLIIKDYDRVMCRLIEDENFRGVIEVCVKVVVYIKTFLKAQGIILCVISSICALTLWLIGIKGGILYGILTGFMDMLPFVGTGIMLLPLAFFLLLQENYLQAVLCAGLYVVCALIREFLEPKLIGDKVGVWPVGILFGVFAGIKLFGIAGIIKGPLALVIICEICRYLWKKKEN